MMMGSLWCRKEGEDGNGFFEDRNDMYMYEPCIYYIVPPSVSIIYDKW